MREGRSGAGAGGKEMLLLPFALEITSPSRGPGLPGSLAAPCAAEGRRGQGMLPVGCAHVFSARHTHTSASPKGPHGTPRPSRLDAPERSQKQPEEEGQTDGHPTATRAQPSASPSAGRGRRHGLARGSELETRTGSAFGLGNVFLMSHIMFFK